MHLKLHFHKWCIFVKIKSQSCKVVKKKLYCIKGQSRVCVENHSNTLP